VAGSVGAGVLLAHPDGAVGRVVGCFRHGCYVRTEAGVYAVAGPAIPHGPLHLVAADPPPLREGDPVERRAALLTGPGWRVDLDALAPYAPWRPRRGDLEAIVDALAGLPDPVPAELAACWPQAVEALTSDELAGATRVLAGRGPGLTPVGDDVLAGLFVLRAWRAGGAAAPEVTTAALAVLAERTTDLSRAFLHWAARGASIEPVHDLARAVVHPSGAAAFERAAERVRSIGASSGSALLLGLATAARLEPR